MNLNAQIEIFIQSVYTQTRIGLYFFKMFLIVQKSLKIIQYLCIMYRFNLCDIYDIFRIASEKCLLLNRDLGF